jgi:FKBP-type peptidyl-prolyl cis-trans isomerase
MSNVTIILIIISVAGLIGVLFLLNSRSTNPATSLPDDNLSLVNQNQNNNSSSPTQKPNPTFSPVKELKIEELKVGTGAEVSSGSSATVHYIGALVDGKVFDSSIPRNQPFTFKVGAGSVIKGWDEGLIGMKVGGKRRLHIPSEKGYGAQGAPGAIPPNATLIFDIDLLDVK